VSEDTNTLGSHVHDVSEKNGRLRVLRNLLFCGTLSLFFVIAFFSYIWELFLVS